MSGWPLDEPEVRASIGNPTRTDTCGGPLERAVPTATDGGASLKCRVTSGESREKYENHRPYPLRHALSALPARRGAAATESITDWLPGSKFSVRQRSAHRGPPTGFA